MGKTRFTMNALLLVVILFSALFLFITVKMSDIAAHSAVNDYYEIEGTQYGIKYSNLMPNGIYDGKRGNLMLEGTFGFDWGCVRNGNKLYLNEYSMSELGNTFSRLVCVDLDTFELEVLSDDTLLMGACASGEIVCRKDVIMPFNYPDTNRLCELYRIASPGMYMDGRSKVIYLDPDTAETVYETVITENEAEDFQRMFIERSLSEVAG